MSSPLPEHVKNKKGLKDAVEKSKSRLMCKMKFFEKELCIIDGFIMDIQKSMAKIGLKDVEGLRNDLSEMMDELFFMIGEAASEQQNIYDELVMKYRQMQRQTAKEESVSLDSRRKLKLKPISIPKFNGTFTTWPTFARNLREYFDRSKEFIELLKETPRDQVYLYLLMKKLPNETRKIYEQSRENPTEEQSLSDFFKFLHKRCQVLESIECNLKKPEFKSEFKKNNKDKCSHCNDSHPIFLCTKFKDLSTSQRREIVKQKSLCILCLKPNHTANECKFRKLCPHCNKRHNGLLHEGEKFEKKHEKFEKRDQHKKVFVATTEEQGVEQTVICATAHNNDCIGTLLATALIRVKTPSGWSENIRALIDQGSAASFMTERAVKKLNLMQRSNNISISGIAGSAETAKGTVDISDVI